MFRQADSFDVRLAILRITTEAGYQRWCSVRVGGILKGGDELVEKFGVGGR